MTLTTGASASRDIRKSNLLFYYLARNGTIDAVTGHQGLVQSTYPALTTPGTIGARNAAFFDGGVGMPRFDQSSVRGYTTRLIQEGEVAGQHIEQVAYAWPLNIMALSMWTRIWPFYTAGSSVAAARFALTLGNHGNNNGGVFSIFREGTFWKARRWRGATTNDIQVAESGATVYPIDVLATLSATGQIAISTRDAAGTIATGTTATNAVFMNTSETWGGGWLFLNGITGSVLPGGQWRYEAIKIARGVVTFSQIDGMI